MGHAALQVDRKVGQQRGRLLGGEVGQHQRDRLGVLVDEEGQQLAGVGVAQRLERPALVLDAGHDLVGPVDAETLLQQAAGN